MPRKKDRYFSFETTDFCYWDLTPDERTEVKICFRAPKILRTKVKEFVSNNSFSSENRVYEEATWKFISNYDYALQVKETIERSSKYIFEQIQGEYQGNLQRVQKMLDELVSNLKKISDPLIDTYHKLKEDVEKTLEKGRYEVQTWILYFIGLRGKLPRDNLLRLVLNEVSYPRWLVEDALALLVQKNLLRESPSGIFSLQSPKG